MPLWLGCRAYRGKDIRFARVVTLTGAVEIGNLVVFPEEGSGLPLFGADLVSLPGRPRVLVVDGAPAADAVQLPPGGEVPPFLAAHAIPGLLFTRFDGGHDAAATAAFFGRVDAYCGLTPARTSRGGELSWALAYAQSHREGDATLHLLGKAFSSAWAQRFVDVVLFPTSGALPQ